MPAADLTIRCWRPELAVTTLHLCMKLKLPIPVWTIIAPVLAWLLYFLVPPSMGLLVTLLLGASLMGAVIAAVHHAEVIAHRVGEPFGTLVLAIAVTIIEVSL